MQFSLRRCVMTTQRSHKVKRGTMIESYREPNKPDDLPPEQEEPKRSWRPHYQSGWAGLVWMLSIPLMIVMPALFLRVWRYDVEGQEYRTPTGWIIINMMIMGMAWAVFFIVFVAFRIFGSDCLIQVRNPFLRYTGEWEQNNDV